ncbi:MAG: phenylalanine--tRNA ligase beta subunit-related protein [Planctomycetota bacterium]|jgi:DNA/RNA-binding domain of Phe-tRNA-synthetase-like protein
MPDPITIAVAEHPLLELAWLEIDLDRPVEQLTGGDSARWLTPENAAEGAQGPVVEGEPLARSEEVRQAVRKLLRHGGYRPTGRGKPASEYLVRAVGEAKLGAINPLVDALNATSLHAGLPISVVDLARTAGDLRVDLAEKGASYVFNATGQEIDLGGLLCLFDAEGPCANAVKDSQRTKTQGDTTRALGVVWGTNAAPGLALRAARGYAQLLADVEGVRATRVGSPG